MAPKRIIKGPNALVGTFTARLAYDVPSRRLFVSAITNNPDSSRSARIVVFDDQANGDVAPLRTIAGAATGLELPGTSFIDGLAIDPERQRLIVSIADFSVTANNKILMFALTDNGNLAPLQTIAGARNRVCQPAWARRSGCRVIPFSAKASNKRRFG